MSKTTSVKGVPEGSRGASLIEIVVALVIGLLVLAGVYKIFHSNSLTYRTQEAAGRIQENGRLAVELLSRDIRMAGYRGCTTFGDFTNVLNNSTAIEFDFARPIEGYDNIDVASLPTQLQAADVEPLNGTDVLVIRSSRDFPVPIVAPNTNTEVIVALTESQANGCPDNSTRISGICQGDILLVGDCVKSRVFQAGSISASAGELRITHPFAGTPGNAVPNWGGAGAGENERFGTDAEVIKVATLIYFVANSPNGVPSLYLKENDLNPIELVEGVDDLQVLYGQDTGGASAVNTYVPALAEGAAGWANVRSVRLALLLRSAGEVGGGDVDSGVYTLLGNPVGPFNDRSIRKIVETTVAIRNRLQ
jgi:type IV pilus assembly protein PilW